MRIAVLVKQIPKFEEMELGPDGRLRRDGIELEMNPYCRRAVSKAVELAANARAPRSRCSRSVRRGRRHAARSDRVGTRSRRRHHGRARDRRRVRRLRHARDREGARGRPRAATGPFDLVLTGRNSVDADTGQVGPELAELLDLPFLTGVRHLAIDGIVDALRARRRLDAGRSGAARGAVVRGAAVRADEGRPARPRRRARRPHPPADGRRPRPGPWGADASPTWVGPVKVMAVSRKGAGCNPARRRATGARRRPPLARARLLQHRRDSPRRASAASPTRRTDRPNRRGRRRAGSREHDTRSCWERPPVSPPRSHGRVTVVTGRRTRRRPSRELGRRRGRHTWKTTWRKTSRGSCRGPSRITPWAILIGSTRVGTRGRVARRAARRGPHRRRRRPRRRQRATGRVEAGVRRSARGRDRRNSRVQMATVRAGMMARLAPRTGTAVRCHE